MESKDPKTMAKCERGGRSWSTEDVELGIWSVSGRYYQGFYVSE
jgi:hypothetical protein